MQHVGFWGKHESTSGTILEEMGTGTFSFVAVDGAGGGIVSPVLNKSELVPSNSARQSSRLELNEPIDPACRWPDNGADITIPGLHLTPPLLHLPRESTLIFLHSLDDSL